MERWGVDVGEPTLFRNAMMGTDAVFHCIHASTYTAEAWRWELPGTEKNVLHAAGQAGAVVVFPESLYSYSSPSQIMTERSPRKATGGTRGVRTMLLQARAESATRTVSVVASGFFGPRVRKAHAGERMVARILAGRSLQFPGSADVPHTFSYVPDFAAAMIRAAETPAAWNQVVHALSLPAPSQRELAQAFATSAGVRPPWISTMPGWVVRAAGLVSGKMRELVETMYQFREPFIMESTASSALLGLEPTPLVRAAAETVAWWRSPASVLLPH